MKENWKNVLSLRLKEEYKKRRKQNSKYTQKNFSDDLNISESMLTQLKNGERNITLDSAFNISEELNCSIDYLVRNDVPKSNVPNSNEIDIQNISNYLGLNDDSITTLKYLNNEGYSKYINDLLFNLYGIDELMYLIKNYFDYEEYDDKNPNDEIYMNGITIDKNELFLLKLRDKFKEIKEESLLSEEKYRRIINEINYDLEKVKKTKMNNKLREYELYRLNSELDKYSNLLDRCERLKERFYEYKNVNEYIKSEGKEKNHGKK